MSAGVWIVLGVLILANALFVAAEFGAVSVRRSRVRRLSESGHRLARRLLPHIDRPAALDRYVGASQIGITISSLLLGAFAQATLSLAFEPFFARWFPLAALSVSVGVVLVVLTAAQLVLGELVPKALALQFPTQVALGTVLPMQWAVFVFRPLIGVLNGAAVLLLRLFGAGEARHRHLHSPEELDLLIAESRLGGLIEAEEQQRLRRALHLGSRHARDLMVPLAKLQMLDASMSWQKVVPAVAASPFSRLPVYRGDRTHVVGVLRVKDLVDRYAAEGPMPLDRLLRPILRVPADLPADRAIATLRERRAHSALVTDDGGRAVGLLTIQDLLGELLGSSEAAPAGTAAAPAR